MSQISTRELFPQYTEKIYLPFQTTKQLLDDKPAIRPSSLTFDFSLNQARYDFSALNRYLLGYSPHLNDHVGNTFRCLIAASMHELDAIKLKWHSQPETTISEWLDAVTEQVTQCRSNTTQTLALIRCVRQLLRSGRANQLFPAQLLNILAIMDVMRQQAEDSQHDAKPPLRQINLVNFRCTYRSPYTVSLQEAKLLLHGHARMLNLSIEERNSSRLETA